MSTRSFSNVSPERYYSPDDVQPRPSFDVTAQFVTVALAIIAIVVLFSVCLHFWARCFQQGSVGASQRPGVSTGRHRLAFGGDRDPATLQRVGLEKSAMESLPVFVYQSSNHKNGLECAVCLCEFKDNENARLLPNCSHSFHVDCIDMWFHSHSTCPLCRSSARPDAPSTVVVVGEPSATGSATDEQVPSSVAVDGSPPEQQRGETAAETGENDGPCASCRLDDGLPSPTQPTNVLLCAARNQTSSRFPSSNLEQGTSSPKALGKIVIDIPIKADDFSSPRLFTDDEQQGYSPGGPSSKSPSTSLRSLKQLLSRDKKVLPESPRGLDVEQAGRAQT